MLPFNFLSIHSIQLSEATEYTVNTFSARHPNKLCCHSLIYSSPAFHTSSQNVCLYERWTFPAFSFTNNYQIMHHTWSFCLVFTLFICYIQYLILKIFYIYTYIYTPTYTLYMHKCTHNRTFLKLKIKRN